MKATNNSVSPSLAVCIAASALISSLAAVDASAQTATGSAASTTAETGGLETITVTAQRREENLQQVPISVQAFTTEQLATAQITYTLDLDRYVPDMFSANNVGQGSANVYYIRGLGQTQSFPTFEPQVGTYVDDIYLARQNANNLALFGVQQLQVLNGPQGTLFGRNSTGGAILVSLIRPGTKFGVDTEVSYGMVGDAWSDVWTGKASVDIPISDSFLTRTSLYGITDTGWVYNATTTNTMNSRNNYGVREAFAILFGSNVRWDISGDYEENNAANFLNQPGPDGNRISYSGFSTIEGGALVPYLTGEKALWPQRVLVTTYGAMSNIEWHAGTGVFNFITGWRGLVQKTTADFAAAVLGPPDVSDAIPTGEIALAQYLANHEITQEIKWTDTVGSRLNYTAGVYYLYETNGNNYGQVLGLGPAFALTLNDQYFNNNTSSIAGYAQGDYKITSALTGTVGLRYTNETKNVTAYPNQPGLGYTTEQIQAVGYPTHLVTNQFTPRLALQYQFTPNFMTFASATKGFQGGGWNGLTGSNPIDFNNFGPENIWTYELGIRSQPTSTLRLNATVFYEDVKNYQLLSDNPHTRSFDTSNASDLYGYGIEANAEWRPIAPLTLTAILGSMNAGYYNPSPLIQTQLAQCAAGVATSCGAGIVRPDGTLAKPVYVPSLDLTVSGRYVMQFSGFSLTPYLAVHYTSTEWFDTANSPGEAAPYPGVGGETGTRTLIDAAVSFELNRMPLTFTAECRNCTMKDYGTANLLNLNYYNMPGFWDLRINYKF